MKTIEEVLSEISELAEFECSQESIEDAKKFAINVELNKYKHNVELYIDMAAFSFPIQKGRLHTTFYGDETATFAGFSYEQKFKIRGEFNINNPEVLKALLEESCQGDHFEHIL